MSKPRRINERLAKYDWVLQVGVLTFFPSPSSASSWPATISGQAWVLPQRAIKHTTGLLSASQLHKDTELNIYKDWCISAVFIVTLLSTEDSCDCRSLIPWIIAEFTVYKQSTYATSNSKQYNTILQLSYLLKITASCVPNKHQKDIYLNNSSATRSRS